jgi:hypothetical protein
MSAIYTLEMLQQMKGQAVKDVWHAMIGKPPGVKNTTGLKNSDEIIKAILEGQRTPSFLETFKVRAPKQSVAVEQKEMPPKSGETKKRGPKPKPKPTSVPVVTTPVPRPSSLQAYESPDLPMRVSAIQRIRLKKLYVDEREYFLDSKTNKLYTVLENKPGQLCGVWNPHSPMFMLLNQNSFTALLTTGQTSNGVFRPGLVR